MLVVSLVLLTVWLSALAIGVRMDPLVHLFGITALLIVITRRAPHARH
jgi:hypothetical protein